jgi:glyoxylase-like metal-dependent hydrolase (beta-lactamase superfamily II)
MEKPYHLADAVSVLPSYVPIPGLGLLPVNAYVLKSAAPVLIDTGLHADGAEFLEALRALIDPRDLRWIWLTHVDQDHVGSLRRLLD